MDSAYEEGKTVTCKLEGVEVTVLLLPKENDRVDALKPGDDLEAKVTPLDFDSLYQRAVLGQVIEKSPEVETPEEASPEVENSAEDSAEDSVPEETTEEQEEQAPAEEPLPQSQKNPQSLQSPWRLPRRNERLLGNRVAEKLRPRKYSGRKPAPSRFAKFK